MKPVAVIIALILACGNAKADTEFDYFKLWHDCGTMVLVVESLSEDAAEIGLTKERIETMVRSRLRAARIYGDTVMAGAYLFVYVNVTSIAVGIDVEFHKWFSDHAPIEGGLASGIAATWTSRSVGSHGDNAGFILQNLSEHIDKFIDEYLRVNKEAC